MNTADIDIIMPLKRAIMNEELRYTLRTIEANFPHRNLWLAGYQPSWVYKVNFVTVSVPYGQKYIKALNNTLTACRNSSISDDFILFNDDFFVMKPVVDFKNQHRGKLFDYISQFDPKPNGHKTATRLTYEVLLRLGISEPINYELHTPMLMNRAKCLAAWREYLKVNPAGDPIQIRSLYGNLYGIGGEEVPDVKIYGFDDQPTGEETYISTNDDTFVKGRVGEYVREQFSAPSRYEIDS